MSATLNEAAIIRGLNDHLRITFKGGQIMVTEGVRALGAAIVAEVLNKLRCYTAFTEDNDPNGEHDYGRIELGASIVHWKIDYYDTAFEYASPNPADPKVTRRVLTLFLPLEA